MKTIIPTVFILALLVFVSSALNKKASKTISSDGASSFLSATPQICTHQYPCASDIKVFNDNEIVFDIIAVHSGKAIEVGATQLSNTQGGIIQQNTINDQPNQGWTINYISPSNIDDGSIVVVFLNKATGMAMSVIGGYTDNGAQIWQWNEVSPWTAVEQYWRLKPSPKGLGYWSIINVKSGKSIDVNGAQTQDGAKVQIWDSNGGDNQTFRIRIKLIEKIGITVLDDPITTSN